SDRRIVVATALRVALSSARRDCRWGARATNRTGSKAYRVKRGIGWSRRDDAQANRRRRKISAAKPLSERVEESSRRLFHRLCPRIQVSMLLPNVGRIVLDNFTVVR